MSNAGTGPGTNDAGYAGRQEPTSSTSAFNATAFLIQQMLGMVSTATLVQIKAVTNDGGVSSIGQVDVLPLVNLVDGSGNSSPHGTIFGLNYVRVQGGQNAVILDPQVGDIGVALFADRDISAVIAAEGQANPGSRRRFSMADGIYLFSVVASAPQQYVRFYDGGIIIQDVNGNTINMGAAGVVINGLKIDADGNLTTAGSIQAGTGTGDAVGLQTHKHPTAAVGVPSAPTPGT